jgi:hypothetical protein
VLAVVQGCSGPGEATEYQPPAIGVEELGGQSPSPQHSGGGATFGKIVSVGGRGLYGGTGVPFCV